MIDYPTVVGIPTTGNTQSLLITLTAILQGSMLPRRILIRSEGHFPAFSNFYLEQLADVARQKGVEFVLAVMKSESGLRGAFDWLLRECNSDYLWMVADDVMPSFEALQALRTSADNLNAAKTEWGYVCGNKVDVNNRRGWPDYVQQPSVAVDFCPTYGNYSCKGQPLTVKNLLLDNSHALFNVKKLRDHNLWSLSFSCGFLSGGDDTLFGARIIADGLTGHFCPVSPAFHLEKEKDKQNFDEPTARAESLLRQMQLLGIAKPEVVTQMFPYCRKYGDMSDVESFNDR